MKNTFTFPHDFGARNDPELQRLVFDYGPQAGWAYWVLVEMLYEQGGRMPVRCYDQVAYAAHVPTDMVRSIVEGSPLFGTDGSTFWSDRVSFTLKMKEERTNGSRTAAQARWEKWREGRRKGEPSDAGIMPPQSETYATAERTLCHTNNITNNSNNTNTNTNKDNSSSLHSELSPTLPEPEPQPSPVGTKILSRKNCQQVVDFWNSTIDASGSTLPKVQSLSDARCDKIRIRWGEFASLGDPVEICRSLFKKAARSKFLQGDNGKGWKASFDWLMTNGKNWVKVIEGNFDDAGPGSAPKSKGERMWENVRKNLEVLPFNEDGTVNI